MRKWNDVSVWVVSCLVVLSVAGCGKEQRGGPRVDTFPITGMVMVDGQPGAILQVKCHPADDIGVATPVGGLTDREGNFSISTYERGDGAPEGEYKVTFYWGAYQFRGGYGGKDKLHERYLDPEESKYSVTVKKGEKSDLGTIELTTK